MRARTALLLLVLVVLGVFAALNWTVFTMPAELSLLFGRVEAPLGVILLGVIALITVLYAVFLAWLETATLLEARRSARELSAQRELAQNAESSRYAELKGYLVAELAEIRAIPESTTRDLHARLDLLETALRADIERAGNTLAAYIGELEERLEGGQRAPGGEPKPERR